MNQKTIDAYNKRAREYDEETATFWNLFPRTFLDEFIKCKSDANVLDLGSGPGRDGLLFQQAGLNVMCLDASEAMVELSRQRGLESVTGDFMNIPFEDKSFDAVWAYTSLLHVPKKEMDQAMEEIRRVLKPDGHLGLGMIEGDFDGYRESSGLDMPRWFSMYTKEEIEELLQKHHFQITYFEEFQPRTKKYLNYIAKYRQL